MKLSIIVPIYKVEPYLRKCIDSILAQTFTDFELILVDDGSPDNCPAICDEYALKDDRIIVIHKEHGGISDARNAGLDIAQGEYIGFVDSDDWIHPQMYERMCGEALSTYDMVVCNIMIYDCMTKENSVMIDISCDIQYFGAEILDNYFAETRVKLFTSVWNKIFKKEIFENLRFPLGRIYEDEAIILNILTKCQSIYVCKEPYYWYYVKRNGSILTAEYSVKRFDHLIMAKEQCTFFEERNDKEQIKAAYSFYLMYYMCNHYAVYCKYPQYKSVFQKYTKEFLRNIKKALNVPDMCRMKFLILFLMFVSPKVSYKLCRKYFPECLYEFMR